MRLKVMVKDEAEKMIVRMLKLMRLTAMKKMPDIP